MRKWVDLDTDKVLQALIDESGISWSDLCEKFGVGKSHSGPGAMQLYNCLWSLADAGLVSIDGVPDRKVKKYFQKALRGNATDAKFRASDLWVKIQMTLNHRWMGAPRSSDAFSMLIQPLFGQPVELPKRADIFVLMPFASDYELIYREHICNVAERLSLSVARADDHFTSNAVMTDVWSGICGAGVVVADCTERNPNVFYEMGISHTVGKPLILITQAASDVPADIRHIKYIKYEYTPPGMKQFEDSLARTIHSTMGIYAGMFSDGVSTDDVSEYDTSPNQSLDQSGRSKDNEMDS
ncbi:MAG: hypothetical protein KDA93_12395 [Planctomycetaceae bacterium]|nr:hypothetical protein [Planctomycetaceae bacterium]